MEQFAQNLQKKLFWIMLDESRNLRVELDACGVADKDVNVDIIGNL